MERLSDRICGWLWGTASLPPTISVLAEQEASKATENLNKLYLLESLKAPTFIFEIFLGSKGDTFM